MLKFLIFMEYKMPYIIGIIFLILVVSGLVMALKEQAETEKLMNIPYRVVKNGVGKYLLQKYKKIKHDYTTDDPRDAGYHYEWVTIDTYDDVEDVIPIFPHPNVLLQVHRHVYPFLRGYQDMPPPC